MAQDNENKRDTAHVTSTATVHLLRTLRPNSLRLPCYESWQFYATWDRFWASSSNPPQQQMQQHVLRWHRHNMRRVRVHVVVIGHVILPGNDGLSVSCRRARIASLYAGRGQITVGKTKATTSMLILATGPRADIPVSISFLLEATQEYCSDNGSGSGTGSVGDGQGGELTL